MSSLVDTERKKTYVCFDLRDATFKGAISLNICCSQ